MNNNNSKIFYLYTQGQRWAPSVLLIAWLLISCNLQSALADPYRIKVPGPIAMAVGFFTFFAGPTPSLTQSNKMCSVLEGDGGVCPSGLYLNDLGQFSTPKVNLEDLRPRHNDVACEAFFSQRAANHLWQAILVDKNVFISTDHIPIKSTELVQTELVQAVILCLQNRPIQRLVIEGVNLRELDGKIKRQSASLRILGLPST